MKRVVIVEQATASLDGCYAVIVKDPAACKKNRYTVYELPASPPVSNRSNTKVIGRELNLRLAKKTAKIGLDQYFKELEPL